MKFLVLSGGSNRGAFQVGALKYLLNDLKTEYQGLCGISIGAINTAILSMYSVEQAQESYQALKSQWDQISQNKVIKDWWPFGKISSLWKNSIYDSSPLSNWINKDLDLNKIRQSGRVIGVGAVSLVTNKYKLFTQNDDNFVKGVIASSSYPGFFTPIEIDGDYFSDGGLKKPVNLSDAINMGATEIDLILCNPATEPSNNKTLGNTVDVLGRTLSTMSNELLEYDIKMCILYNKLIETGAVEGKRYIKLNIIRPEESLITDSMDFSPESYHRMFNIGYELCKKQYKL